MFLQILALLLLCVCCAPEDDAFVSEKTADVLPVREIHVAAFRGHIGVVVAKESVRVSSLVDGTAKAVLVGIGSDVVKGQALAEIDDRSIKIELSMAKASARAASARGHRADVAMRATRSRYERYKIYPDTLSGDELRASRLAAKEAKAERREAYAQADVERGRVRQLKHALSHTVVVAPFSGKISLVHIGLGAAITRGMPIVSLMSTDDLRVNFAVPVDSKERYRLGGRIRVRVDSSQTFLEGVVRGIAPNLDPVTKMISMQAEVTEGAEGGLQPGIEVWVLP